MGILANSATVAHSSSSADDTNTGYISGERVTLTISGAPATTYQWSMAIPSTSATARSALSNTAVASPSFLPDVAGFYVLTCVATTAGVPTTYILRISVRQSSVATAVEALRLMPIADALVPAPPVGCALYFSEEQGTLCMKLANGDIHTVDSTAVP